MSFRTISAILRGRWLLDKTYAQSYMPFVFQMLNGQQVNLDAKKDESNQVQKLNTFAGAAYGVGPGSDLSRLPPDSIAVVSMNGPLMKYGDMCSWGMVDFAALINRLGSNGNVRGIIIDMDSPGGQADGTALTADAITRARQRKPVVSLIDDGIAASAAEWISSAANEVYVTQATDMVGSVGVYTTIADWYAHYQEHWHLPVRDIYAPQSTDKNKDYQEALKGNDDMIKAELKVLADQFIKTIKRNRAGKLTSDEWTTGKMFYAKDAIRIGLIDGIKSFDQVVDRVTQLMNK